jgi:hypothetical protein
MNHKTMSQLTRMHASTPDTVDDAAVTIAETDAAFNSQDCGRWTRAE